MPKNKEISKSEFYCTYCAHRGIPIARRVNQQREPGHLKKLFCLHCQKETNHAEIRPFGKYTLEDFLEEYELGRFIDGKRVAVADLTSCKHTNCAFNKHGKCWNADKTYECEVRQ